MPNFTPKTRILAVLVIVLGLAGMSFLLAKLRGSMQSGKETTGAIQAPVDGSLAVSVEGFGFTPYDTIVIRGAGFNPDAATAVVFTTTRTKKRLTVPAFKVMATEVRVPVPPLEYNDAKGTFVPDQVSLMVVQMKRNGDKLSVRSSNQSKLFMVYAPTMPSAVVKAEGGQMPKGSLAQVVLAVAVEKLKSAGGKVPEGNPEVVAAIAKAQKGMEELLAGVEKIKKNPKVTVRLATTDGSTVSMGVDEVAKIDVFYGGYLGLAEERLKEAEGKRPIGLISAAYASTPSECYAAVMGNPDTDSRLNTLVEILCGSSGGFAETGDAGWINEPYLLQLIATLKLSVYTDNWNIPLKVAAAAELSMYFDLAIEGKLPDVATLKGLLAALGGEVGDKVIEQLLGKRMTFLANLQTAIDAWDLGCKAFKWSGCLSSREIAVGVGDIIMDIGDRINYWLLPYVDAMMLPGYSKVVDLEPVGISKGGYDELIGPNVTSGPYLPEPDTTPSQPSPKPIVPDDITPEPTPMPVPTPAPKPVPVPTPNPPSCLQEKEAAQKLCLADCPAEPDIEEYNACTTGCDSISNLLERSNCINNCIGARSRAYSARSSCVTSCLNAYYNTKCP